MWLSYIKPYIYITPPMRATCPCLHRSYKSYEYAQITSLCPPSEHFSHVRWMYQSTLRNRLTNLPGATRHQVFHKRKSSSENYPQFGARVLTNIRQPTPKPKSLKEYRGFKERQIINLPGGAQMSRSGPACHTNEIKWDTNSIRRKTLLYKHDLCHYLTSAFQPPEHKHAISRAAMVSEKVFSFILAWI